MKKLLTTLIILSFLVGLFCETGIISIRAQDFEAVACRFVLDLTVDAGFTVSPKANGFQIDLEDFDAKDANRRINSSIIKKVSIVPTGLFLETIPNLRFEMMRYGDTKQAVIDFFIHPKTREQSLAIANFYTDREKYAQADEIFAALYQKYPQDDDILYHWGIMLKRSGSPKPPATPKTPAAPEPETKPQPQPVRQMEAEPGRRYVPQLPPEDPSQTYFIDLSGDDSIFLDSLFQSDSLITLTQMQPVKMEKVRFLEVATELASRHFMLTLILFVSALVIIYILLFGGKKKKNRYREEPGSEILALRRMVARLLADGWTHKEIARELKVNSNEIAKIANLPQRSHAEQSPPETDYEPESEEEGDTVEGIEEYHSDFLSPKIDLDIENPDAED